MELDRVLFSALDPIAPTEADAYEGGAAPGRTQGKREVYVTFQYDAVPDDFGDDEPGHERALIQVHLYAPIGRDVLPQRRAIKRALFEAGFTWPRCTNASDKTGQHHVFECEAAIEMEG